MDFYQAVSGGIAPLSPLTSEEGRLVTLGGVECAQAVSGITSFHSVLVSPGG